MQREFIDQKSYAIKRQQSYQEYKNCATHQLPGAMESSMIHGSHQHSKDAKNAEVPGHAKSKTESHIVQQNILSCKNEIAIQLKLKMEMSFNSVLPRPFPKH